MKIIEDKNNELLNRKEIKIIVEAGKNPSMQEAVKIIADHFKTKDENIVVKGIKGKFGRNTFLISSFIYDTKEAKEKIERKTKGKKKKEGKKEEKPAEKAAEKPAEESSLETSKSSDFDGAQKSKKISEKTSEKTAKA